MGAEEWKRRYAERLVSVGGLPQTEADAAAEVAVEHASDWMSPEDAANEEMTYWAAEQPV